MAADHDGRLDDSGNITDEDARALIHEHPAFLNPICVTAMSLGFSLVPRSAQQFLTESPAKMGRDLCRFALNDGYFDDGAFTPHDVERLYQGHPMFGAPPLLAAGLMADYDADRSSARMPRGDFVRVARRVSIDAFRRGLVHVRGGFKAQNYSLDRPAFRRLLVRTIERMRTSGEIH